MSGSLGEIVDAGWTIGHEIITSVASAAMYAVGPGKTYTTLGAVAGLLAPGDLVRG